jgi:hypothetical protein
MKIIVRGDCCSRRAIVYNKDIFGGSPEIIQDEKSRSDFFIDSLEGKQPSYEDIASVFKLEEMSQIQRIYAIDQINRNTLSVTDADLIVMDSYADMNFRAWKHRYKDWKIWVNFKFLHNKEVFDQDYEAMPRLTMDESMNFTVKLINSYRKNCGKEIPVLYLTQPWHYYSKLADRIHFYEVGNKLEEMLPTCFHGRIDEAQLEPADMGSCGSNQTLHFTGLSYRAMIQDALNKGLRHFI